MRPISNDLRERLVEAVKVDKLSRREAAARFKVGVSTAIRVLLIHDLTGGVEPRPQGGARWQPLNDHVETLREIVDENEDASAEEMCVAFCERAGVTVSPSSIGPALRRHGLRRKKKSLIADEQTRPDVAIKRGFFRTVVQNYMDHRRFFFVDETGVNTKMTRLYGWAYGGERLVASVPHGHWKSSTFLAAMGLDGIVAPFILDGACDAKFFEAWTEKMLAPALLPGDVVVMDNLPAHKRAAVEAAIRAVGASVMFTPPYSPDMNPIEKFFSKLKAALRKAKARTVAAVETVILATINSLSRVECENFFKSCGYDSL